MSSSIDEILGTLAPFIENGMLGLWTDTKSKIPMKEIKKVKYNELVDFKQVFSETEILNGLPNSKLQQEAASIGLTDSNKIIEFVKSKSIEAHKKAKETQQIQQYDCVLLPCINPKEECNWDIVTCYVTPDNEFKYKRCHTY